MTQQVQTTLDYKAELNLIEWVWHQEGKIKEHSQVEPAYWYEWEFLTANIIWPKAEAWTVYQGNFSIVSQRWWTEFRIFNGNIRIPLAWCYTAKIKVWWWYSWQSTAHHSILVDNEEIYTITTNSAYESWATVYETILNLGRFSLVTYNVYFSFSWSDNVAWWQSRIYLQKL